MKIDEKVIKLIQSGAFKPEEVDEDDYAIARLISLTVLEDSASDLKILNQIKDEPVENLKKLLQ